MEREDIGRESELVTEQQAGYSLNMVNVNERCRALEIRGLEDMAEKDSMGGAEV